MRWLLVLLLVSACDAFPMVPRAQVARDLECPEAELHISLGLHAQVAEGCGRSLTYVRVCREEEKVCRFEPVRSWAELRDFR